jgi:hypothetical protein
MPTDAPEGGTPSPDDGTAKPEESSAEARVMVSVPEDMLAQLMRANAETVEALRAVREESKAQMLEMADELATLRRDLAIAKPNVGPDLGELDETKMYIRLKPYNKRLGHLRKRTYLPELKCVVIGGTGAPGDIPQWHEVDEGVAAAIKSKYRQDDNNSQSPPLCDVVTAEERVEIDKAEEMWRRTRIGISGQPDIIQRQTEAQTRAQTRADTVRSMPRPMEQPREEPPALVAGAEEFKPQQPPKRVHNAGRGAALDSLPDERFPSPDAPLPDGMDKAIELAEANPMDRGRVGG